MAAGDLGDLIIKVPIVLEDDAYRQQVAAVTSYTQEQMNKMVAAWKPGTGAMQFAPTPANLAMWEKAQLAIRGVALEAQGLAKAQTYSDNLMNSLNKLRVPQFAEKETTFTPFDTGHSEKYFQAMRAKEAAEKAAAYQAAIYRDVLRTTVDEQERLANAIAKTNARRMASAPLRMGEDSPFFSESGGASRAGGALRGFGTEANEAVRTQKALAGATMEAHARFGVMANSVTGASTVVRLLTGESGFLVIELGRTALYLGRATTAAGGFAAVMATVARATSTFIAQMGKALPILILVGTAYKIYSEWREGADAKAEEAAAKLEESNRKAVESQRALTEATIDHWVALGLIETTEAEIRKVRLKHSEVTPQEVAFAPSAVESEIAKVGIDADTQKIKANLAESKAKTDAYAAEIKATRARAEGLEFETRVLLGQEEIFGNIVNEREHAAAWAKQSAEWANEDLEANRKLLTVINDIYSKQRQGEREAIAKADIDLGGRKASEGMAPGSIEQRIAMLAEQKAAMVKAANEGGPGISMLGPGGGAFRFGPGAMGSTIGVETESKKQTAKLESIDATIKELWNVLRPQLQNDTTPINAGLDGF